MSEGYRAVSADSIISVTHCYKGVKNASNGTIITKEPATILETDITTYVVMGLLSIGGLATSHIEESRFIDEKNSKKALYRAIRENGQPAEGRLFINQSKVKIRDICPSGVLDITDSEHPILITNVPSTIIRTETKTFVIKTIIHHTSHVFMEIDLGDVKGTANTKKSSYTFL